MIVCPRCSYENEDSAMNCASCRINLQWALENLQGAVPHDLESVGGPPPEEQARDRVARVGTSSVRGFLVIVLLLAIPASGFLAFYNLLSYGFTPSSKEQLRSGYMIGVLFWVVVALVCIPAAIVVLLRRQPKPNVLGSLRILALIVLTGGLLFGLMRLTLVILPEHTGPSLITQYKLGERDFTGANLHGAHLRGADLRGADLRGAELSEADLRGARLYQADLGEANLYQADLSGACLCPADLNEANLHQADLSEANLNKADLSGADLSEANLSGANLYRIIVRGADLSEANLSDAMLREADLSGADLRGADLSRAVVTNEQLAKAKSLEGTILPDGSVHE